MFPSYRRLFATPGTVAFTLCGLLSRLAYAMAGVSTLTAIAVRTGSFALAGAVSAAGLVGLAISLPLLGRLVDRHGQRRVAVPAALFSAVPGLALPLCLRYGAPSWTFFLCAVASSGSPNIGGMARARWSHLHRADPAARDTANSLEQVLDELCFMTGPAFGMLLCTALFPEAGLLAASLLATTGALLFASRRRTEPPVLTTPADGARSPLRTPGTGVLVAAFLATGMVFGSLEVTTLAYAGAQGHRAAAGLLLGLLAAGSCVCGLLFGLLRARSRPRTRFLLGLTAMTGLLLLPLAAAALGAGVAPLAAVLFLAGAGTAPTMVTGMTLLQEVLPKGGLNEGMALAVAGIMIGISAGSALGGLLAQHTAPGTGYALPAAAAALALLITLTGTPASPARGRSPSGPGAVTPVTAET